MSSAPDLTSRIVRRERALVAAAIALLVVLSWLFILDGAGVSDASPMAGMRPALGALVTMWWVMMAAMMLPSATPAIMLYARVREARSRDSGVAETWVFLLGYMAAWLLFSLAAATAQWLLIGPSMTAGTRWASAAVLILAGLYQLSPLKGACIRQCRSPAQFISRHCQPGSAGAVRLGIIHGAYCVGCCWLLMALLFVGGIMNSLWIAGLSILVAVEKLAPAGPRFGRAAGAVLIAWGVAKLAGF